MSEPSGPFGWMSPAVACLTKADPEFWQTAVEMDGAALHTLGLILGHCDTLRWQMDDWKSLACALRLAPRRELIARYAPGVPLSALNLARKFSARIWRAPTYRAMAQLCRDNTARKWLAHAARISPADIAILRRLPPAFRTPALVGDARHKQGLRELRYRIVIARKAYPSLPDRALARLIEEKRERGDLWSFRVSVLKGRAFPVPPWPGDEALHPIRDYSELERTALAFRNCLRNYALDIHEQQSAVYVYSLEGRAVAAVEIVRDAVFGWEIAQISGPGNEHVPVAQEHDIVRRFARAGVSGGQDHLLPEALGPRAMASVA